MAKQLNNSTLNFNRGARRPAANAASTTSEAWRSDAFLNFYLPGTHGGQKKLGTLNLRLANPTEGSLLNWLREAPETNPSQLANVLLMEFIDIREGVASGFALPGMAPVAEETPRNSTTIAFLNFYLPTKSGGQKKVGAIVLREDNANQLALANWLAEDPEAHGRHLMNAVTIQFVDVAAANNSELALA